MALVPNNPYYRSSHWRALRAACIKRDKGRCFVPGCSELGTTVDHIITRPRSASATPFDRLDNLRLLCRRHDDQVKEGRDGKRGHGGVAHVIGNDASGRPSDPQHSWNR